MSIISNFFANSKITALQSQIQALSSRINADLSNRIVNNSIAEYPTYDIFKQSNAYTTLDDVHVIIRRLVGGCISIPVFPYFEKSKNDAKRLKGFNPSQHIFERKLLENKALADLPGSDPVAKLMDVSNEFWEYVYTNLFIFGRVVIYKKRAEYGVNKMKPLKYQVLLTPYVVNLVSVAYPKVITGYDYIQDGITIYSNIPPSDIIDIRYINPNSTILALSPIEVLKKRITRVNSNMDASVSQLQNGGVPGIVYDKDDTAEVGSSGLRKDNFNKFLNNSNNKGAPYFSSGELGYIQLGLSLVDLNSADLADVDFDKICNMWGISSVLFNNKTASTESNVKEMRKAFYTDAVLPAVAKVIDAMEVDINNEFIDKKRVLNADLSTIPELQPENKMLAEWLNTAYWVTPNEKREMMKFEKLNDPIFETPLIPSGLIPLADLSGSEDLPLTNDYLK